MPYDSHDQLRRALFKAAPNLQQLGVVVPAKWESFGWKAVAVDGHDVGALVDALQSAPANQPMCIVANTVKGKGVSFMENSLLWHYRSPQGAEYDAALAELGVTKA